jgi:hypothetical protein
MKRFVLLLVLAAAVFYLYGDPAGAMRRFGYSACEWLHVFGVC